MSIKKEIADELYDITLKYIQFMMGKDETYSDKLDKAGREVIGHKFAGVFPVDKLTFPGKTRYAIVNLDRDGLPGSHWVGIVKGNNGMNVYDSFGRKAKEILPLIKKRMFDSDLDSEQKETEDNCGQRSLAWLFIYKNFGKEIAMQI